MEADAEIHYQTLVRAWESLEEVGDRIGQARGIKDSRIRPTVSTNPGSWRIRRTGQQMMRVQELNLGRTLTHLQQTCGLNFIWVP